MDFLLLGPLEVWHDGERIALGPRRGERCLLGLLLLHAGRTVPLDRLLSQLWDDAPPRNAPAAVQTHVARLRSVLDPDRDGRYGLRLVRVGDGYLADTDPDTVDAHRFRADVARAATIADPAHRAAVLRRALACWRGPVLADVASDRLRDRVAAGLDELRLCALESRIDAELACGRHEELVPELTDLTAAHPLRDHLTRSLMLALYRCGRHADALAAYRRARDHLADEAGLDPGPELAALHEAVLRADPGLDGTGQLTGAPAGAPAGTPRPAQLPGPAAYFTGRAEHLNRLDDLLPDRSEPASAVTIAVVSGTAGVGKTSLAVHWAHRVADRFPDGQLYVNLRGFGPAGTAVSPAEAIRGFLDALGVPPRQLPATAQAQLGLYRSRTAGRRLLIVLDNAGDAAQVRPLLPGSAGCLVLVTSRNALSGLVAIDGARPLNLDLLTEAQARQLLARRLGGARVDAEPAAVDDIVAACAGLPLALVIVAGRAAAGPDRPLAELAGELGRVPGRLGSLADRDPAADVRTVFSWSYRTLGAPAARLFRLLGLHPGPDIGEPAAAALADLDESRVRPLLAELVAGHLLDEPLPGRFAGHDLIREYAAELATGTDPAPQRRAAVLRLFDHYAHTASAADARLNRRRRPLPLPPGQPGSRPLRFAGPQPAGAWFGAETACLLAAVDHAAGTDLDAYVGPLTWTLATFLDRQGRWHDMAAIGHIATAAAERRRDEAAHARADLVLGGAYAMLAAEQKATDHLHQALQRFERLADPDGQCHVHRVLSWVHSQDEQRALDHDLQALTLARAAGNRAAIGSALNAVGFDYALLGDHRRAVRYCRASLDVLRDLDDPYGEANAWDSLGYAYHHLGEHAEALHCYRRSLQFTEQTGDRYIRAETLANLGETHRAIGDPDAARDAWKQAGDIFTELDHPAAGAIAEKLRQLDADRPQPSGVRGPDPGR